MSVATRILEGMTGTTPAAAFPGWVVPPATQVEDLFWLAYAMYQDTAAAGVWGIHATVTWVRGGCGPAPVTGRGETPVTRGLARAEMWAAIATYGSDDPPPPPPGGLGDYFGVPYRPPLRVSKVLAAGVLQTLGWMLGEKGQAPPLMLPFRDPSGRPLTTDQLYTRLFRADPDQYQLPERRRELQDRTERLGLQSQRTAALIEETKRRVAEG